MAKLDTFAIEEYMNKYESTPGCIDVGTVVAAAISVDELVALNSDKTASHPFNFSTRLTYGEVPGSEGLRTNIASLYQTSSVSLSSDDVLITQGTAGANFLVYYSLLEPGDHVVCIYPTFQQLISLPKSFGAEVSLWKVEMKDGFIPSIKTLESLVRKNTKIITLNNPHNPTGTTFPESVLKEVVAFAKERGIIVLSDDIYRPLFHSLPEGQEAPPSILSFGYDKVISTSSTSKCFSLPGIRVGWIATRDKDIQHAVSHAREYTTISVSQLDDQIATHTFSPTVLPNLIARNTALSRTNLALLEAFMNRYAAYLSWVKPTAGTMAFIEVKNEKGELVDDLAFCLDVLEKTKVLLVPGSLAFGRGVDFKGFVRIGYAVRTELLQEALEKLGPYIERNL